jgi:hypothetical protein
MMKERFISQIIQAQPITEGAGAYVKRSIGGSRLLNFDPFLLLDEFLVTPPAGFPYHAHRGFEAVTYMVKGAFRHRDRSGNAGTITEGELQLMNTGRGITHMEMPGEEAENRGFQLWVNLPRKLKESEPTYQFISRDQVPSLTDDGLIIHALLGQYKNLVSPAKLHTPCLYLDIKLSPALFSRTEIAVPKEFRTFLYVYEGKGDFWVGEGDGGKKVTAGQLALLDEGDTVVLNAQDPVRLLLGAGQPHGEPIHRRGPYVD